MDQSVIKRNLKWAVIVGSFIVVSASFAQVRGMGAGQGQGRGMGGAGYCAAGTNCQGGEYNRGNRGQGMRARGSQLSAEERAANQERMRNAKSYEEAQQIRNENRQKAQATRWNSTQQ